jgi:putative copper export protein
MIWAGIALWLHLLAAIFWVGGQLFLVVVVLPVLRQNMADDTRVRVAAQLGRRFARLSAGALGLLVVTGPLNAVAHGVSLSILAQTQWGQVLVAKAVLVLAVLVITTVHALYYGRRLKELADASDAASRARRLALQRRSVRLSALNLLLNLIIVGLAAWLGTLP